MPINVDDFKMDLASLSSHKIYGPKGVGALYVRRRPRVRLEPVFSGGGQERVGDSFFFFFQFVQTAIKPQSSGRPNWYTRYEEITATIIGGFLSIDRALFFHFFFYSHDQNNIQPDNVADLLLMIIQDL